MAKRGVLLAFISLLFASPAFAQAVPLNGIVVSACGTTTGAAYIAGQNRPITVDINGKLCLGGGGGSGTVTSISNSDGTLTLSPNPIIGVGAVSLALSHANTWLGAQSFTDGDLVLLGASSGSSTIRAPATGGGTATLPAGSGTLVYSASVIATAITVGTTTVGGGSTTNILFNNAGTLGEYTISGTGSVCMTTNCVMVTPNLGTPSVATLTSATGLPISTGVSGLGAGVATLLGGASSGTSGPAGTASPTFTGTLTAASIQATGAINTTANRLTISGARSVANISNTGSILFTQLAAITTDTADSGTVASGVLNAWLAQTVTATSATTFTNFYGSYFTDPIASTNTTFTAKWSLGADSLNVNAGTLTVTGGIVRVATASGFQLGGNATIFTPSTGVVTIYNSSLSGFSRLQLGGTSSSFPAIKVNGAALNFRLADDSADISVTASTATFSAVASDAAATDNSACFRVSDGLFLKGSGTLGVCLGTSSMRFKVLSGPERPTDIAESLVGVMKLHLINYRYKPGFGDGGKRRQNGLFAEDLAKVFPECVLPDKQGRDQNVDPWCLYFRGLKAQQEMQGEIIALRRDVSHLIEKGNLYAK